MLYSKKGEPQSNGTQQLASRFQIHILIVFLKTGIFYVLSTRMILNTAPPKSIIQIPLQEEVFDYAQGKKAH